ncbi:MAG TPA: hypothetical protein VGF39_10235 [Stellaceae bacterium]
MDFEYPERFRDLMKMKPSEYWPAMPGRHSGSTESAPSSSTTSVSKRRCGALTIRTATAMAGILEYIERQFQGLSADVVHKITCENATKYYGLIN